MEMALASQRRLRQPTVKNNPRGCALGGTAPTGPEMGSWKGRRIFTVLHRMGNSASFHKRNSGCLVLSISLIRLLPSRVGFAERDASRPAFGGSSLALPKSGTCVGGGPYGPRLSVRPSVGQKKSAFKARKNVWVSRKRKKKLGIVAEGRRPEDFTHCARRRLWSEATLCAL